MAHGKWPAQPAGQRITAWPAGVWSQRPAIFPSFEPNPIDVLGASNILGLWIADQGVTVQSGTAQVWTDVVNGIPLASTGVAAEQPLIVSSSDINGQQALRGDGIARRLGHNAQPVFPAPGTTPGIFWAVAIAHGNVNGRRLIDGWASTIRAVIQTGTSIGVNNSANVVALSPPANGTPFLLAMEFSNGTSDRLRINNSITQGNAGNFSGSGIRLFRNGAGNYGDFSLAEMCMANGRFNASQQSQLFERWNSRYALGLTDPGVPLVFLWRGQSNARGLAVAPYYVPSPVVQDVAYVNGSNAFVAPVVDPVLEAGSAIPAFVETLREAGINNPIIIAPYAISSTSSADWVSTHAAAARTKMLTALARDTGAIIGGIITWQGETDAQNSSDAAAHASRWNGIYDADLTAFASYRWAKSKKFIHIILPSTVPTGGAPAWSTAWNTVIAVQTVLAAGRADSIGVQPIWAGTDVHLDVAAQQAAGIQLANAWLAAA